MNSQAQLLPLGDFKHADEWQTHVNEIFFSYISYAVYSALLFPAPCIFMLRLMSAPGCCLSPLRPYRW